MSTSKAIKRVSKHTIWLLIAVATGGAWIFYFADAPTLLRDFVTGNAVFAAYGAVAMLTFTTYVFGGLLREQVCTYMCPWPRIQAAMLDEHSLTVTYNDWRGEPRSRHAKRARAEGKAVGDCVDCNACVAVCPMGIDIREGQQLECITCALCIDACDGVMNKLGFEKGLISYATLGEYDGNMLAAGAERVNVSGDIVWNTEAIDTQRVRPEGGRLAKIFKHTDIGSFIRPRTLVYCAIWCALGLGLLVALLTRDRLDINVAHDRNPLYVVLSDGAVRNGFSVKILNMKAQPRSFTLAIAGLREGSLALAGSTAAPAGKLQIAVKPDQLRELKVYVRAPRSSIEKPRQPFQFVVNEIGGNESAVYDAWFESPKK